MKIGLDFDGVIADCGKLKRAGARQLFNIDIPEGKFKKEIVFAENLLSPEQYRVLQRAIYDDRTIGLNAEPVADMKSYIALLQKSGHELIVITSREQQSLAVAKEWLQLHHIDIPIVGVGQDRSKENACRDLALDIFVDDDFDKLEELSCVPHLFLFSWEYNNHIDEKEKALRVSSWKDLYEKIAALSN